MLVEFLTWLENLPLSARIGESWWFPLLESVHVVGITLVVGAILMVDLRLLGVAARSYSVSRMSRELLPWTWGAFFVSVITGFGMFMTRANHYMENPAFQAKLWLLLLAGANMIVLHFVGLRSIAQWDTGPKPPISVKVAGALSLMAWTGVLLAGRWTGHLS